MKVGLLVFYFIAVALFPLVASEPEGRITFDIDIAVLDSEADDTERFGYSCDIFREFIVVGAPEANNGAGAAYVFEFNEDEEDGEGGWVLAATLTASDSGDNDDRPDNFGGSVSVDGNFVVVGAEGADQAYLFQRNGTDWTEILILFPAGVDNTNQGFGSAVHIDDRLIAVAAENWDGVGAVFVFDRSIPFDFENPNWGQIAHIGAELPSYGGNFGSAVFIDGDYLFVGANGAEDDVGQGFVFGKDVGGENDWGLVTELSPSELVDEARFGSSMATRNGVLAVGAPTNGGDTGRVYLFIQDLGGPDNWGELKFLTTSDNETANSFGNAVAISRTGETIFAAADTDNTQDEEDAGALFLFDQFEGDSPDGDDDDDDFLDDDNDLDNFGTIGRIRAPEDDREGLQFGNCIAISEDNVAVIGAANFTNGEGRAYVISVDIGSGSVLSSFLVDFLRLIF